MKGPPHQLKKIISLSSVVVLFGHIPSLTQLSEAVSSRGHTVHESIITNEAKPDHQSEELPKKMRVMLIP